MSFYRVLSLDGGGIRGVLSAVILDRLERRHPFLGRVDLFAGTSTGGILSLGLAAGYTPADLIELYTGHGPQVFADSFLDDFVDMGRLVGAEYSLDHLETLLYERFGGMTLAEMPHRVLISSFDLDNGATQPGRRSWKPKFFHNFPGDDSDGDQEVVDVALRTSAAPTYFPVHQGFIDGGVIANNPSTCALAQALNPETGGQTVDQVALLSLGTGRNPKYLEAESADWGLAQWAPHLVSLMLEGSVDNADYQCRQILGGRYMRINPLLPQPIDLDGVDQIPLLRQIGEQEDLSQALAWLEAHF